MKENTVTINPLELEKKATAFGVLVRGAMDEDVRVNGQGRPLAPYLLYAMSHFLSPLAMNNDVWLASILSTMDIILRRKISFKINGNSEEVIFPEWDPSDLPSLDCYPVADAFINFAAWECAMKDGETNPKDYYGPVLSLAGYVLGGVKKGFHLEGEDEKREAKAFFDRLYEKANDPEQGAKFLVAQLNALTSLFEQYANENGAE